MYVKGTDEFMLYIRADMNEKIATGHIMRCVAIANAAKKIGECITFILADNQAAELLDRQDFSYIILGTTWNNMESEIDKLLKVIDENKIKILLIDSYEVTQKYLQILSEKVKVVYIDDINKFTYPVHTLICYANYWKKFSYGEKYSGIKLLLGPCYAPLREAFNSCERKEEKTYIENLLFLSGGTDQYHILETLLHRIEIEKYKCINVIYGKYYTDYKNMCEKFSRFTQIHFHQDISNIEEYMKQADMAISAGGTTLYELCACGTPTISYSFADNQLDNVLQFQKDNLIDYAGDVRNVDIYENINLLLKKYFNAPELRKCHSRKMQELVDGKGAERIIKALLC